MSIKLEKSEVKNSELKYIVKNNNYHSKMTYDYEFYEVFYDNFLVGYAVRHNILACKNTEYIDIYICSNYRNKGIGSKVLEYFIANYCKAENIAVFSSDRRKSKFLSNNGFIFDEIYIYKNLYKRKRKKE